MNEFNTILETVLSFELAGIPLQNWLMTVGIGIGICMILVIARSLIVRRFQNLTRKTSTIVDDIIVLVIKETRTFFFFILGIWAAHQFVDLSEIASGWIGRILFLATLVQAGLWGSKVISWWVRRYREQKVTEDPSAVTTIQAMGILSQIFLWLLLFLLTLDNFGVDVTALITGLGIGGIAVALAVQNILGDILASLSIIFDKPFVVGDFLIVNDFLGTVENVGLKTTRLRSLSGEQIIFSNNDLLSSRIRNYKRMNERRIVFTIGVEYSTPRTLVEEIPGELRSIIEAQEQVRFDRSHFKSFGDFALIFECVYFVLSPDYNTYMDIQQSINNQINRRFEELGATIAFPTQKLFIHGIEEQLTQNTNGHQAEPHED